MNTCKDCKWWKRNKNGEYRVRIAVDNYGQCLELDPTEKHPGQSVWIDIGSRKRFETFEDFGCIHWEKKE